MIRYGAEKTAHPKAGCIIANTAMTSTQEAINSAASPRSRMLHRIVADAVKASQERCLLGRRGLWFLIHGVYSCPRRVYTHLSLMLLVKFPDAVMSQCFTIHQPPFLAR